MKKSELLRGAKKRLARTLSKYYDGHRPRFICVAVGYASGPAYELRKDICDALGGGLCTYEDWLKGQGVADDFEESANFEKLQQSRLAWMDAMIAYYEAKGE